MENSYGSGKLKVKFGYDTVVVNGITVTNQQIGLMDDVVDDGTFDDIGAIIGLAYPRPDHPHGNLFNNMMKQGKFKTNVIGYYLNGKKGMMTFGYVNDDMYKGKLNKHPIVDSWRWTVKIDDVLIDGKPQHVCDHILCRGLVDTGTSDLTMPLRIWNKVEKYIPFHKDCYHYHRLPKFGLVIGGVVYNLKREEYIKKYKKHGKEHCSREINHFDFADALKNPKEEIWLIGETFLKKYFSVYDRDTNSVHLAKRK